MGWGLTRPTRVGLREYAVIVPVPALLGGLLDLLHEVCEWDEALDGDGA